MSIVESGLITPFVRSKVSTKADTLSPLSLVDEVAARKKQWQKLIDDNLIEWAIQPELFDDDDIHPSRETIAMATRLARVMANAGNPAPSNVVTDANGGIVFERREGMIFESMYIAPNQTAEYRLFEGGRLVVREPCQLE